MIVPRWPSYYPQDVAHALLRAASRLVSTLVFGISSPTRCRNESRHATHECVRHVLVRSLYRRVVGRIHERGVDLFNDLPVGLGGFRDFAPFRIFPELRPVLLGRLATFVRDDVDQRVVLLR